MLLSLVLFVLVPSFVLAATNRTIDDTLGDSVTGQRPRYLPSQDVWNDATCTGCAIQPDPSLAFDGTWTAATYNPSINISIELDFTGTAIYVFFILANNVAPGITTLTECNFTLDGVFVGNFTHQPDLNNLNLQYNQLVFTATNLDNQNHTLVISTSGVNENVFVNFDYANYTVEDDLVSTPPTLTSTSPVTVATTPQPTVAGNSQNDGSPPSPSPSSSSSSLSTGAIAGLALGSLAIVTLVVVMVVMLFRRRQQRYTIANSVNEVDPFPAAPQSSYQAGSTPHSSQHGSEHPLHWELYTTSEYSRSNNPSLRSTSRRQDAEMSSSQFSRPGSMSVSSSYPQHTSSLFASTNDPSAEDISDLPRSSEKAAALRQARQLELENQMRRIKQELRELNSEHMSRRASLRQLGQRREEDDQEVQELREQIRMMREHMQTLAEQAESPWALGWSDVPPPGYTASSTQ